MKTIALTTFTVLFSLVLTAQVAINADGSAPNASAMLDVSSDTAGILIPRMQISHRDAISSPATGLLVFCSDDSCLYINRGLPSSPSWYKAISNWFISGTDVYYNGGNVGIGTTSPDQKLHVEGDIKSTNSNPQLILNSLNSAGESSIMFSQDILSKKRLFYNHSSEKLLIYDHIRHGYDISINTDGDVGIGTTSPDRKLHVEGDIISINNNPQLILNSSNSAGESSIMFSQDILSKKRLFYNHSSEKLLIYDHNRHGYDISINTDGDVGIGTTSPDYLFHVYTDTDSEIALFQNESTSDPDGIIIRTGPDANPTSSTDYIIFQDGDGTLVGSIDGDGAGGVNYNETSDARLKMNIEEYSAGLETVSQIEVRSYEMKSAPGIEKIGLIAQELQEVYPQAVSGSPDSDPETDPMMIDYGNITPLLISAIQELQKENDELKQKLATLETRIK